jgi:hypothetical protein
MGAQLVKLFEFAKTKGGLQAQMRLAMKTGITSAKAAEVPDSPGDVAKVKAAIKELTGAEPPA